MIKCKRKLLHHEFKANAFKIKINICSGNTVRDITDYFENINKTSSQKNSSVYCKNNNSVNEILNNNKHYFIKKFSTVNSKTILR